MSPPLPTSAPGATRHLALGTLAFALCFAAGGLVSAFAPRFRADLHLSASQTALLVAVPGAIVSGLLFAAPFALYAFVLRVDAQVRR